MIDLFNKINGYVILFFSISILLFSRRLRLKITAVKNRISASIHAGNDIELNNNLCRLIIMVEDRRFERHLGVDFYSIVRAVYRILAHGKVEGASTLPQQLVRTITNERAISAKRKVQEIIIATIISFHFSKKEIFTAYFNLYPINNSIGIPNFCIKENLQLNNLSIIECCQIVARLKYPIIANANIWKYRMRVKTIELKYKKHFAINLDSRQHLYQVYNV